MCQVGQRADGEDLQFTGVLVGQPDQEVHRVLCVLGVRGGVRVRQGCADAADAVVPVHRDRPAGELPHQRLPRPDGDGDGGVSGASGQGQQAQRVLRGTGGVDVAVDGADTDQLRLRGRQQVPQGEGVVDAGVAVEVDGVESLGHSPESIALTP